MPISAKRPPAPAPFWHAPAATLYHGDVRACLRALPARSVHCVVTSPPYWGLRDYGTGMWEGGAADCDHVQRVQTKRSNSGGLKPRIGDTRSGPRRERGTTPSTLSSNLMYRSVCSKCGAKRTDVQIGMEPSPDCKTDGKVQCGACFVCSMVGVFREVHRVLRDDGVCWLNLGDTYAGGGGGNYGSGKNRTYSDGTTYATNATRGTGLPNGNLIGIPWRVALALQADGWILRSDVPWVKRDAMPESVEGRPCKSLEYIFMLTKGEGYYFDMEAVRPAALTGSGSGGDGYGAFGNGEAARAAGAANRRGGRTWYGTRSFRNSDLWFASVEGPHGMVGVGDEIVGLDVTKQGYPGAHYAVFAPKLITPLILSGTSEYGCCAVCSVPWERVVVREGMVKGGDESAFDRDRSYRWSRNGKNSTLDSGIARRETAGWRKVCSCQTRDVAPCTVLDPFVGSGTTVATALMLGRAGIGIELSEEYLRNDAIPRIESALSGGIRKTGTAVALPPLTRPTERRRLRGT